MSEWKDYRLKDIATYINGFAFKPTQWSDTGTPIVRIQNLTDPEAIYNFYDGELSDRITLNRGDLLISWSASIGVYIWNGPKAYLNQHIFKVLFDKMDLNKMFFKYLMEVKLDEMSTLAHGSTMTHIQKKDFDSAPVRIPPLPDQHRITLYLDAKTGEIDGRLALLEQKLDAYARLKRSVVNRAVTRGLNHNVPLKNSQVEWIGQIPQHWESYRLKDIGSLYSGLSGKSGDDFRCDDEFKTKPFIQFTNVLNNTTIDATLFGRVVMEENEQQNKVELNDLIFLMSSEDYESIAKPAVVRDDLGEIYLNSFCRGMHIDQTKAYSPFVNYQLNSDLYRNSIRYEARGFTRINIKVDRIACQQISLPPLSEQQAIADYLDGKCAEIDAAMENIDKQIDACKRLKRSLINEVVTGKRAV